MRFNRAAPLRQRTPKFLVRDQNVLGMWITMVSADVECDLIEAQVGAKIIYLYIYSHCDKRDDGKHARNAPRGIIALTERRTLVERWTRKRKAHYRNCGLGGGGGEKMTTLFFIYALE